MSEPAAQSSYRVPRSTVDDFYVPSQPLPESRVGVGTVVSIDSLSTCTVLISDVEIVGVVWLGLITPTVGDVVEVEARGDLLCISSTNDLDTFLEGIEDDAVHIVSDEDPGEPPVRVVNVGGSMRNTDAWQFLGAEALRWTTDLNESGQGMRCSRLITSAVNDGILWSADSFDIEPGDRINIEAHFLELVPTTTAQVVLLYSADENANPLAGDPDTVMVVYGSPVTVLPADTVLTVAGIVVPPTLTFPVTGVLEPATAKLGLRFVGDADSQLVAISTAVTVTPKGWPLGSLWLDPNGDTGGIITIADTAAGLDTHVVIPYAGGWTPAPLVKKAIVTAPPDSGGIVMAIFSGDCWVRAQAVNIEFSMLARSTFSSVARCFVAGTGVTAVMPFTTTGFWTIAPGEELTIVPMYQYMNTTATDFQYTRRNIQVMFFPGAVEVGGASKDPAIRYFDGDSWRPSALAPAAINITQDATVVAGAKGSTTTALARSASTLHAGTTLTLTATVTPTATGTVTFYRSASTSGPWTSLGSSSLASGKATKSWASTGGKWYFKATYAGSTTLNGSTSPVTAVTNVQVLVAHTVAIASNWSQAYNGSNNKISGSGVDGAAHQGYYSSTHGNRKTLLHFPRSAIPAAADVYAVTLVCRSGGWDHWYNNGGGTLVVGMFVGTDVEPTTWPSSKAFEDQSRHAVDVGGFSVNLSSWASSSLERSDWSGITLGPGPTTSHSYYGYSASPGSSQFSIKVSYRLWELP